MSGTKTAFCIGAVALAIAATGNAIEPRTDAASGISINGHAMTMETVKASSAQLTGRMIAPYLPTRSGNE